MKKTFLYLLLLLSVHNTSFAQKNKKPTKPALSPEMVTATSKILNDFESNIKPESFGKKWVKAKDEWSKKAGEASSPEDFAKVTEMLAKNINSDSYKDSWKGIKSSWSDKAGNAKNIKQVANLFKQLESHIKPDAYAEGWAPMRDAWIASLATLK